MIFEMLCKKTDYYTAGIIYEYYMTDKYKDVKHNYNKVKKQLLFATTGIYDLIQDTNNIDLSYLQQNLNLSLDFPYGRNAKLKIMVIYNTKYYLEENTCWVQQKMWRMHFKMA
jgi:ribosomal protein L1